MADWVLYGAALLVGALLGSFLNVVISRLPRSAGLVEAEGRPSGLAYPPSQCEACGRRLRPFDLIPVLSYILLRGRCRTCGAEIGIRHLLVEIGGSLLGVATVYLAPSALALAAIGILFFMLLALTVIDAETGFLPDRLTLPLLALGLGFSFAPFTPSPVQSFIGALVGGGGLWLLAFAYRLFRGREGLGGGDVKLVAAGGAWCGAVALPALLLIASVTGLLFALFQMVGGRKERALSAELRFGPFLCAAIALTYTAELLELFAPG
ncbi:prepilin peptidase [Parvularcula maris]|uniref:Prepilin leader peptidase/N-methyltransferase n=1 Tax=Parvularcula maris TaxID=2965077 RepID=A0A9X2L8K5_9PROT|nr:A24 family peptidase [Parvularcula maris]MCQ8185050.1 prepilin peptidase [Parvularcula maris]